MESMDETSIDNDLSTNQNNNSTVAVGSNSAVVGAAGSGLSSASGSSSANVVASDSTILLGSSMNPDTQTPAISSATKRPLGSGASVSGTQQSLKSVKMPKVSQFFVVRALF